MAKQGFGHCAFEPSKAVFQSATFERHCQTFEQADHDQVEKRQAWLDGEKQRFLKEVMSHVKT